MKEIIIYPNPVLSKKSQKVKKFDESLKKIIAQLSAILLKVKGVGLAAPQIGISQQISVIQPNEEKGVILINPKILNHSATTYDVEEGCLSLPNKNYLVKRYEEIALLNHDLNARRYRLKAKGLLAQAIQHEVDHLNGVLICDIGQEIIAPQPIRLQFLGHGEFAEPIVKALEQSDWCQLVEENPDLVVVANYGRIISPTELKIPGFGYLNFHGSLLPKLRGASPIQTAILTGLAETGVTLFKMDEKVDHGPIISTKKIKIDSRDTTLDLKIKLGNLAATMVDDIRQFVAGKIEPKKQDEKSATACQKIKKSQCQIDLTAKAEKNYRLIRACYPDPKAFTFINGSRIIIHQAELIDNKLKIIKLQKEGRKPLTWEDFSRGLTDKKILDKYSKTVII